MATQKLPFLPIAISTCQSLSSKRQVSCLSLPSSSLYGNKLLLKTSNLSHFVTKRQFFSTTTTAFLALPTSKRDSVPSEKSPKWSARAIRSFALGELEARKVKYPNTGTESLLMGILVEGTSQAAKFLRANGITFFKVQEETLDLLGKSDMTFLSPERPPLTEQAQRVLDWAVDEKLKSGAGESSEITTTHLLLGIWRVEESAGHKILAKLGFNDEKAKELEKYINEEFVLSHK